MWCGLMEYAWWGVEYWCMEDEGVQWLSVV